MKNFEDAQFMSAKDKELTFRQWKSFLKFLASPAWREWLENNSGSDYGLAAPRVFTDRIYKHLSLHCGFIAHFNIHGFFSTYFSGDMENLRGFFKAINGWGDTADLTKAMMEEYQAIREKIFLKAGEQSADRFALLKECVKRAETDKEFQVKLLNKIF